MERLPHRAVLLDDPDRHDGGDDLKFRLTYAGPLRPDDSRQVNGRATHKHSIRRAFHPQLKALWDLVPHLNGGTHPIPVTTITINGQRDPAPKPRVEQLAENFQMGEYRFVPLVTEDLSLSCELDILFLRASAPGGLIVKGGDIDNRIKTLFDALQRPQSMQELGECKTPGPGETPFFCLLENDKFVTKVSVETDRLLEPINTAQPTDFDARLIIGVTITPYKLTYGNIAFGA
jgi:hypothetical protein